MNRALSSLAFVLLALPALAQAPSGRAPTHTGRALSDVPNAQAITRRIWAPGLDEGYVPQGLTVTGGALYVSAYLSADPGQDRGPCRLYRLDPGSGAVLGALDLPAACGHAGGLAKGPGGSIFLADTRIVFEIAPGGTAVLRSFRLAGAVKGSFAAGSTDALWLGSFERGKAGTLYRFPFSALRPVLSEADAAAALPLPSEAQGAGFDGQGRLWLTRSTGKFGELLRLDPASGAVEARHAMPAGVEDLSFDASGRLWTLSEAGSRRWNGWTTYFPLVFALDPARLR